MRQQQKFGSFQLRHTMEAVFVSYALAFFFSMAFERPFFHFDDMILSPKKREAKQAAKQQNGETIPEAIPMIEKNGGETTNEAMKYIDEEAREVK